MTVTAARPPDQYRQEFKDGAQQDVAIPISSKGFGQALDAMTKQ
jgi:invasion protein IalB